MPPSGGARSANRWAAGAVPDTPPLCVMVCFQLSHQHGVTMPSVHIFVYLGCSNEGSILPIRLAGRPKQTCHDLGAYSIDEVSVRKVAVCLMDGGGEGRWGDRDGCAVHPGGGGGRVGAAPRGLALAPRISPGRSQETRGGGTETANRRWGQLLERPGARWNLTRQPPNGSGSMRFMRLTPGCSAI